MPGITVVLIAYISEEYPEQMAQMMSLYVSGTVLGGFSGRFFAGHLHELLGWRMGYGIMAICTLIGAFWALKMLPKSTRFIRSANAKTALSLLHSHTKNRHVLSACLLGGCVLFSLVGCFTFINLHLADAPYHLNASHLANIFALYLIGMVITPLSGRVIARIGMTKTIILAVSCSLIGVLITLAAPLPVIIIGLTIMSSGVFITQSATISYIGSHVKEGRSLASGLYYFGYYGGGSIGAWACAIAYSHGGWGMTVASIVGVQILALAVVMGLMKKA
ncbi:Inner membrane transport protein ynfM [Moraxella caviae]|nr:Inner membrane transport protein ynfM [Moraxella caviae]